MFYTLLNDKKTKNFTHNLVFDYHINIIIISN